MPDTDQSPLTYADYLRAFNQGSEGGNTPMSEQQWNQLSPQAQWALLGGGFMMDQNDPRYAGLAGHTGNRGGNIVVQGDNTNDSDFVDPTGVHHGQGYSAYDRTNMTPQAQSRESAGGLSDRQWAMLVASLFGGAALAGGALGGAAGAEGGALTATIPEALPVGGAATGGSAALADLPAILTEGQALGAAGGAGGGLAGLGQAAQGGALTAEIPGSLPLTAVDGGAMPALAGTPAITQGGAAGGGLVNSLGGYGNIARGALGLASLGASARGGSDGGGGGSGTDANSIIEQMARANRVNQTTPLGARTWSQDANGQWSVADTMNPAEQANFENVQGMNADVTGMARQRLAAMLAAPPRQRYDRPLGT